MNCCQCRELLSPYLDGVLSENVRRTLEGHLRFCPSCREELKAIRQTIEIIHTWSEEELELPAGFVERLRSRLEEERRPWYRRPGRGWVSLSAAVVLIMVMAFTARANSLRPGFFNTPAASREQGHSQALTGPEQPARRDVQAAPMLTLPPAAPVAPPRQPAPEIKEGASQLRKAPARTPRFYRPAVQKQGQDQGKEQKERQEPVLVGVINLNSRSGERGPATEEQAPAGGGQNQPPAAKGQLAGQQPGTTDQTAGESPGKIPGSSGQASVLPQPGTGLDTGGTFTGSSQGGAVTKPSGTASPVKEGTLSPAAPAGTTGTQAQPATTTKVKP
ncbi:anti-sigma factor [Moorella naiadis]|uniref:anti-sigma factor family protein n=1 Tax=Moorella naiadis (nom. illeg.) TaxID=3093670 RepID=UPI003D9CA475